MGLSNYLTGACTPPEVMQKTDIPNLAFMASGPLPPNAADLLGGPGCPLVALDWLEVFDLIVIDGPPVLGLADASSCRARPPRPCLSSPPEPARLQSFAARSRRLQLSRANLIGAVLTKYDAKTVSYGYGYGDGHEYSYQYSYRAKEPEPESCPARRPQERLGKLTDNNERHSTIWMAIDLFAVSR